jgi:hypothetical protein
MVREQDLIQRLEIMVARDGVEPPTVSFVRAGFFEAKPFFNQQLHLSSGHSIVTIP